MMTQLRTKTIFFSGKMNKFDFPFEIFLGYTAILAAAQPLNSVTAVCCLVVPNPTFTKIP